MPPFRRARTAAIAEGLRIAAAAATAHIAWALGEGIDYAHGLLHYAGVHATLAGAQDCNPRLY
jgi:hypothetical protein